MAATTSKPASAASPSLEPGAGDLGRAHLRDRGADHAGERGVAAADVDAGHPALPVGDGARGRCAPAGRLTRWNDSAQSPAAHTPSTLGPLAPVDADRALRRRARCRPRTASSAFGAHADAQHDQVGRRSGPSAVSTAPGLEARRPRTPVRSVDAVALDGVARPSAAMSGSSVPISWAPPSTIVTSAPQRDERLGHLQADVAAADHDDPLAPVLLGAARSSAAPSSRVCTPCTTSRRRCRAGRARVGAAAGGDQQLVEAELQVAVVAWSRTSTWRASRSMPIDLVARCGRRCAGRRGARWGVRTTRSSSASTSPADHVGDAAGRVAGPVAPLEDDDLEVGPPAPGLEGRRHPAGVAPITMSRSATAPP